MYGVPGLLLLEQLVTGVVDHLCLVAKRNHEETQKVHRQQRSSHDDPGSVARCPGVQRIWFQLRTTGTGGPVPSAKTRKISQIARYTWYTLYQFPNSKIQPSQ